MQTKTFQLSQAAIDQITKTDASITHWSVQLGKLTIQCRNMESALQSLYESKQNLINRELKEAGIDPARVNRCSVSAEGTVLVAMEVGQDDSPEVPPEAPEVSPPNGA
jgi:hypothetical protein